MFILQPVVHLMISLVRIKLKSHTEVIFKTMLVSTNCCPNFDSKQIDKSFEKY